LAFATVAQQSVLPEIVLGALKPQFAELGGGWVRENLMAGCRR